VTGKAHAGERARGDVERIMRDRQNFL